MYCHVICGFHRAAGMLFLGQLNDISESLSFFSCISAWISCLVLSCLAISQSRLTYLPVRATHIFTAYRKTFPSTSLSVCPGSPNMPSGPVSLALGWQLCIPSCTFLIKGVLRTESRSLCLYCMNFTNWAFVPSAINSLSITFFVIVSNQRKVQLPSKAMVSKSSVHLVSQ